MTTLDLTDLLLVVCSIFFAMNMGGAGFSPSFSAPLGAKLISRRRALVLFTICIGIGALLLGGHVAKTLGGELVPASSIDRRTALFVIASASAALLVANLVKVPESTSWVTVFTLSTLGVVRSNLNVDTILWKLLPAWISVPLVAFVLTYVASRQLYPLRGWNYRVYEHLTKHEWKLRLIVLASSCYLAIAVGANNVANVVGPLATAGVFSVPAGMLLLTPLFALGAIVFSSAAKTVGSEVVPLGLYSAAIINVVAGSLVIVVSWLGIPQSLVHTHVLAVFAVALAKDGSYEIFRHKTIRKIVMFWFVSPLLAGAFVAGLLALFE